MKSDKEVKNQLILIEDSLAKTVEDFRKLPLIKQVSSKGLALKEKYHKLEAKKQMLFWVLRDTKKKKQPNKKK